jgi:hypothetical protein
MRLTDKGRWGYKHAVITPAELQAIIQRDEWIRIVREKLPDSELDFLEIGAAPGNCSAAMCHDRPWRPVGIDYSDDADKYLETLAAFGKNAELFKFDFLEQTLDRQFDIVMSAGVIEHFRGKSLTDVITQHDRYLRRGGYVVINVPNFTGFQYLWHYALDRPDLDNHNIDAMRLDTFELFGELGYETLFLDYVGVMRLWGNSSWTGSWFGGKVAAGLGVGLSALARGLDRGGLRLSGRSFAPHLLYIGRKSNKS